MCGKLSAKILAAILAAVGFTVFFSAVGDQIKNPAMTNPYILSIFGKYLVGVLFIGAAKMVMWKTCATKVAASRMPARKRR